MSSLSRKEIVLLNCLTYLNIEDQDNRKLGAVVDYIIEEPNRFNELMKIEPAGMGVDNWREVLNGIKSNERLCSLTLRAQSINMGYDSKGLNAVCFIDKETKEATFVFRGTGRGEWLDNGIAFSGVESPQQVEALEYFERAVRDLKLQEKGYAVDVTGHSKGGNKAQYITIRNDVVRECISFDGQGFSDEALKEYSAEVARNRHKITTIAANKDYVHCLGNEIAMKKSLYETKYPNLKYGLNHCPDAIICNGRLQPNVFRAHWVNKMINLYSINLMKLAPNIKKEVFTSFMGFAQMYLGKTQPIEGKIPSVWKANKALIRANVEFSRWFSRDRSEFSTLQKVAISALHIPIFNLVQVLYTAKYQSYSDVFKRTFENLKRYTRLAFGDSQIGKIIKKFIETSHEELKKVFSHEQREKTPDELKQNESNPVSDKKREQVLEFEPKEAVDKLSNNGIDQMLIKRDLFFNLKNKDDLLEVVDKVKDITVKNFAREKLYEVKEDIKKSLEDLNKHTAVHGDIKSIGLDDKNKYLLEKNNSSPLMQKNEINKNNNLETSINDLYKKIMSGPEKELIRTNESNKALDIKEFCKISMKLEENREKINEISEKISQIDKSISKIEEKEKLLSNVENNLKIIDQKPANTHNKLSFFQNKNQQVNKEYEKAMSFLKTNGISNWKEFGRAKEEHENNKSSMKKLITEKNQLKSNKYILLKEVSLQKDSQKVMMKNQEKNNINKNREHKLNKVTQMEI